MVGFINPDIFDNGLAYAKAQADKVYICSAQPANYTEATSTYALGVKDFGAGNVFPNAIADALPTGSRKIASAPVTNGGDVIADGVVAFYAVVKSGAPPALLAANALTEEQEVSEGNTFTLQSFDLALTAPE